VLRHGSEPEAIAGEPGIFAVEDCVFLDAVRTGEPGAILSTYPDAARTLELTLAANEAMLTGRPAVVGDGR
jgi:hypothetical protein